MDKLLLLRTEVFTTLLLLFSATIDAQDYEVTEIQCTFAVNNLGSTKDTILAKLRKPEGFKGHPLFADDRGVDPESDLICQIRPDLTDQAGLRYNLKITDFGRCGVLKRNGFVHVRVWFPQFPGVVMQSDQELIIMCKPPEPTVIENKAAGFAGSFPHGARVSGVVEETPGRLEYEVALYKEAPAARISNISGSSELPVDQAVPIGTKLQLRARINPDSAWKYVKLMEVTVSPDPDDPHMSGSVALVKDGFFSNMFGIASGPGALLLDSCLIILDSTDGLMYSVKSTVVGIGCRNRDFASIIPHQPARYRDRHNEVFLDFEAFLLSTMKEKSTLWIHSQIKACMEAVDCQPDFCLDLFEPSGHGRRRRRSEAAQIIEINENKNPENSLSKYNGSTQFTKIQGNLEYTVLMPGEFFQKTAALESSCSTFLAVAAILGCLLFMAAFVMCWLASKLHSAIIGATDSNKNVEDLVRDSRHYDPVIHYLNQTALPLLQQGLILLLEKVRDEKSCIRPKSPFNGIDFLSEFLHNMNPVYPDRKGNWTYIFDMDWVQKHLVAFPRPYYPFSLIWTREYATLKIQSYVRAYFVRRREEVQEMRNFWKEYELSKEKQASKENQCN